VDLFSWDRFFQNIPKLLKYFPVTLEIVLIAEAAGVVLAVVIALARINKVPALNQLFIVFVSFMRGTPMYVQILVVLYGLPMLLRALFGLDINALSTMFLVITTYALNQGAFVSEIFRASILSIPSGQTEAGYSIGLTKLQTFRRVIAPQAVRIAIPAFGTDFVSLFQNTSLVFLVGIIDMMGRAVTIQTTTQHILESYLFVMIVFVVISLALKFFFITIDKKLSAGTVGIKRGTAV
jgi:L-cystine transport system permease protein